MVTELQAFVRVPWLEEHPPDLAIRDLLGGKGPFRDLYTAIACVWPPPFMGSFCKSANEGGP
jgi:hypothetical protein